MFTAYKNKKISVFVPADDRTAIEKIADKMRETFGEVASRPGSDFYDAGAVEVYAFANGETITKNFKKIITAAGKIFDEAGDKMLFVFDGNKINTFCRA